MAQAVLAHDQLVAREHGRHQGVVEINFAFFDAHDVIGDIMPFGVGD